MVEVNLATMVCWREYYRIENVAISLSLYAGTVSAASKSKIGQKVTRSDLHAVPQCPLSQLSLIYDVLRSPNMAHVYLE